MSNDTNNKKDNELNDSVNGKLNQIAELTNGIKEDIKEFFKNDDVEFVSNKENPEVVETQLPEFETIEQPVKQPDMERKNTKTNVLLGIALIIILIILYSTIKGDNDKILPMQNQIDSMEKELSMVKSRIGKFDKNDKQNVAEKLAELKDGQDTLTSIVSIHNNKLNDLDTALSDAIKMANNAQSTAKKAQTTADKAQKSANVTNGKINKVLPKIQQLIIDNCTGHGATTDNPITKTPDSPLCKINIKKLKKAYTGK